MPGQSIPRRDEALAVFATQRGFALAVEKVMPALRAYARRLTRNPADGDDLIQDTLALAWKARLRFEPGTNLKAWLFTIARNCFLGGLRHARRSVAWDPTVAERSTGIAAQQDEGLYMRELERAIQTLPAPQREAFRLVTQAGLSLEEAASRMGVKLSTLKSRLWRARQAIVGQLEGVPPVPPTDLRLASSPENSGRRAYLAWKRAGHRTIGA